ncbi:MAG: GNAT family protein [Candidatus Zixiibacteriota bacterium]
MPEVVLNTTTTMSITSDHIFLRGKKVLIRALERDDIDKRMKWKPYPDPLYFHYNLGDLTREEKEAWFLRRKGDVSSAYLAIDNPEGQLIGFVTLYKIDPQEKTAWLGIYLGCEFVDRGFGTDATLTLLRYYFDALRFEELFLDVASHNQRAIRCYEKCGFRFVRTKYSDHDPRMNIDIFGDERFKDIRKHFVRNGDKVLVEFDEMAIDREGWSSKTANRDA